MLIGILAGVAEATAGLSKGYFGQMSDVTGKRVPFVRAGYSLSAFSKPMMAIFTFPVWIFFARTLDRLGKGIRTSARDAILSDETTREHKGKVFGFHRSMDTVGAAIGPVFALLFLLVYPGHYKWLFILAVIPGIMAIMLTFLLKERGSKLKSHQGEELKSRGITELNRRVGFFSYLGYWKRASATYRYLVSGLLIFTLFNSSDAFLLLALKEQHLADTVMIGIYVFYNLVYALFSYPVGAMADRIGLKTMLVFGLFLFALVYLAIGFVTSLLVFGLIFFIYGLYAACTEGISKALISNLAAGSDTATAIGFYNSLASICTLLASSIAGILWFTAGPRTMFIISGTGVLAVVVYLLLIFNKKSR